MTRVAQSDNAGKKPTFVEIEDSLKLILLMEICP
jgi:hypothetical protein